jgi:hypothetical protein
MRERGGFPPEVWELPMPVTNIVPQPMVPMDDV